MLSDLEARLLEHWSTQTLDEYSAALRAADDPRGDLIALDLVIDRDGSTPTLRETKKELETAWLGEDAAKYSRTRYGFIERLQCDVDAMVHVIEAHARYLRRLDLWGDRNEMRALMELFGAEPRPWLHTLVLRGFGNNEVAVLDPGMAARFEAIAPRLTTLEARGHRVADEFPHAGVEHLIVDGHDAVGALRGESAMPNVRVLDLAFHPDFPIDHEPSPDALRSGLVRRAFFPNLHTLDLSRNEPRTRTAKPNCLGGKTPIFDVLPLFEIVPHIEKLRVPSVRNANQLDTLQKLVDRLPHLHVEIARMYDEPFGHHPRITMPSRTPWPAADRVKDYDALVFEVAGKWERVDYEAAYEIVEGHYTEMTAAELHAWAQIWPLIDRLPDPKTVEQFPFRDLRLMLDSFDDPDAYNWNELRGKVKEYTAETIPVRHINGYEAPFQSPAPPERKAGATDRILEHERALQEHFDLERLAVYADDLIELGDTRGELISVDLQHEKDPSRTELDYRHDELHEQIFGSDWVIKSKFGLTTVDVSCWSEPRLEPAFKHDVARYLRELEINGPSDKVNRDLALVLAEPRPWLRRVYVDSYGPLEGENPIAKADFLTLWPNLEEFELVIDHYVPTFLDFAHPKVKRMKMRGAAAFVPLGEPWPAVVELDFTFGVRGYPIASPERVLTAAKLPALRHLDLSRNEPVVDEAGERDRYQCNVEFFPTLRGFDRALLAKLVTLKLPSPRTVADVDAIQFVLDNTPVLESLEIARRYAGTATVQLRHPTAKLVIPEPCVWKPADSIAERTKFSASGESIELVHLVFAMERHFFEMSDDGQAAWTEIWRRLATNTRRFSFPATTLYTAIEALRKCDDYSFDQLTQKLMTALHAPAIAQDTTTIELT